MGRDFHHICGMPVASFPLQDTQGGRAMDTNFDFERLYPHHDLLIEIGRVEMAIEHLDLRAEEEQRTLRPRLESRMHRLRDALDHLAA